MGTNHEILYYVYIIFFTPRYFTSLSSKHFSTLCFKHPQSMFLSLCEYQKLNLKEIPKVI